MFKRSQRQVADSSRHWYQDKYQHVLVQRNIMALLTVVALGVALVAVFAVSRLAPLKSVEPYLLQMDEKTGLTQKVEPISRGTYASNEAVDRYFIANYLRYYEGYNPTTRIFNDNVVRLMSSTGVFVQYRRGINPANKDSVAAQLGTRGQRAVKINSIQYLKNEKAGAENATTPDRIMQVRLTTTDITPNSSDQAVAWVATITFHYAQLNLNGEDQLLNPLGFQVINYQIMREIV